jgi:magnesium chelatase subunit I
LDKAIRSQFIAYFPNPETLKKRRTAGKLSQPEKKTTILIKPLQGGLTAAKHLDLFVDMKDAEKINALYKVRAYTICKKYFPHANEKKMLY